MNITQAKEEKENGQLLCIKAVIDGVEVCVPIDLSNRHYAEIMRQVEEGTLTIAEADE